MVVNTKAKLKKKRERESLENFKSLHFRDKKAGTKLWESTFPPMVSVRGEKLYFEENNSEHE